ncbi:MAG: beta-propeller fold lactonase family protein [Polyangiaceae bacterium]
MTTARPSSERAVHRPRWALGITGGIAATALVAMSAWGGCDDTSTSGATSSSGTGAGPACTGAEVKCGDACVDTTNDPAHCGGCDTPCAAGEVCTSGQCAITCSGGTTKCGGTCVDTDLDPANCGGCDAPCATGEVCSGGKCALDCAGGTTKCGNVCVDTDLDPANCGGCNAPCATGEVCSGGTCALDCTGGTTKCGNVCVDTNLDPANCGGCNAPCGVGETCSGGQCALICTGGTTKCGNTCVNTNSDPNNCGGCNAPCGPSQACVDGACAGLLRARFAYVDNDASPNSVTVYGIAASGALTQIAGSPFPTGGSSGFNHHPDGMRFCGNTLYVTNTSSNSISGFTVAGTGALTALAGSPFTANASPVGVQCTANNAFLYATDFASSVFRYSVSGTGALTQLGSTPAGATTLGLTLDAASSRLFVSGFASFLSVFNVNPATGALTAAPGSPTNTGGTNHSASVSPNGLFVATEGQNSVRVWAVAANGSVTQVPGSPFADPVPCEVVGLVWAPDGKRLFVTHRGCIPGRVMVYNVGLNGALSAVVGAPFASGGSEAIDAAVDFDGSRLFVTHNAGGTSVFTIGSNGALTLVPGSPFANPATGNRNNIVLF